MGITKRRTDFPYYKVQELSDRMLCWVDARKEAFSDLAEARRFAAEHVQPRKSRIVVVERDGRRVLEESSAS